MRAVKFFVRSGLVASLGALVPLVSACSKEVKANFPRPPASAAIEPPEEAPAPVPMEETPHSVEEVATSAPVEADPEPEAPAEADARRRRRRALSPPPPPEEPAPAAAPSPQLARSDAPDPELVSKLERAEGLLSAVAGRRLSREREEQLAAARAFLAQARAALDEGDERRAVVLIDKGLILAEDVERASRP